MEQLFLETLQNIARQLQEINQKTSNNSFTPMTRQEIQKIYPCLSNKFVSDMFNDPKFPAQRQGKEDVATLKAVEEYCAIRHERD